MRWPIQFLLFGAFLFGCADATLDPGRRHRAELPPTDAGPPMHERAPPDAGSPAVTEPEPARSMPPPPGGPSSNRHTAYSLGQTNAPYGYYEYLPPTYGGELHPLLVFWHGSGEKGNGTTELDRLLRQGPPRLIANNEWPAERPFIVLSPQYEGEGCETRAQIQEFLAYAVDAYRVDPERIYLTGLSCGAIGIWTYLSLHGSETISAAVPIAGRGRKAWDRAGCEMADVALWAFHGGSDTTVSPEGSQVPIENLQQCGGGPEIRLTIYDGVGHGSWRRTYDLSAGHDIYTWLLNQS